MSPAICEQAICAVDWYNSRQSASSHLVLIHPANVTHRLCGMFNVVKCLSLYIDVPLEFSVQETANYE